MVKGQPPVITTFRGISLIRVSDKMISAEVNVIIVMEQLLLF